MFRRGATAFTSQLGRRSHQQSLSSPVAQLACASVPFASGLYQPGHQMRFASHSKNSKTATDKGGCLNPFTKSGRIREGSKLLESLTRMGFAVEKDQLVVGDPAKLNVYGRLLRTNKAILPLEVQGPMKIHLGSILQCEAIADPAAKIAELLRNLYNGVMPPEMSTQQAETRGRPNYQVQVRSTKGMMTGVVGAGNDADMEDTTAFELNDEQQKVVDLALEGYNLYIGGQAGTGKTVVLRAIRRALRRAGCRVAMTATTGIAGCHIDGCTFHHTFGCDKHGTFTKEKALCQYDAVIIDEVSMMTTEMLQQFDKLLRMLTGSSAPFGGIQVIVSGDFLQLSAIGSSPVFKTQLFKDAFLQVKLTTQCRQSEHPQFSQQLSAIRQGTVPEELASTVKMVPLDEVVPDAVYLMPRNDQVQAMNQAELDKLPGDPLQFNISIQPPNLFGDWTTSVTLHTSPMFDENAFRETFLAALNTKTEIAPTDLSLYQISQDGYVFRVRLPPMSEAARRETVFQAVEDTLRDVPSMLDAGSRVLLIGGDPNSTLIPEDDELLTKTLDKHPVIKPLNLKIGARVLLRANLSPKFVNGSIGVVEKLVPCSMDELPAFIHAQDEAIPGNPIRQTVENYHRFLTAECGQPVACLPVVRFGEAASDVITIPPWRFSVGGTEMTNYFEQSALCIPLSLAYAFTVHKVQGLTLRGKVHIKLENMFRCEHLMYVGMSRVKHPDQLTIAGFSSEMVVADETAVEFDRTLAPVSSIDAAELKSPLNLEKRSVALWKSTQNKQANRSRSGAAARYGAMQSHKGFGKTLDALGQNIAMKRATEAMRTAAVSPNPTQSVASSTSIDV